MTFNLHPLHRQPARPTRLAEPRPGAALLASAGLLLAGSALAGRPLSTDDPNTADAGTCQVELWTERSRGAADGGTVLAPTCGLAPGLELGADQRWARAGQDPRASAGLGLKWAPQAGQHDTAWARWGWA